jgi:hypothetical protein
MKHLKEILLAVMGISFDLVTSSRAGENGKIGENLNKRQVEVSLSIS